MPDSIEVADYATVLASIRGRSHLLLGNGFSIACDDVFRYQSLYEVAVADGLSEQAQAVFGRLGTNNFEGVLRLLEHAHWLCAQYGIAHANLADVLRDVEVVKSTLVHAVTASHLEHSGCVSDARKEAARVFLKPFHNIFTTNYDLLLYWTILSGHPVTHGDGFRSDEDDPDAPYVVFSERLGGSKGIFYLHGALHLYVNGGQLRKHTWNRNQVRLTEQIRASLAASEYPLIVSEGTPEKKLEQIERNGYLWYALDKLHRIEGPLVVFGHSLGPSDQHIVNALASADNLPQLFVGLHGPPDSDVNLQIRAAAERMITAREARIATRGRGKPLFVGYFDSSSTRPWG